MEFQWRAKEKKLSAEKEFERQAYIDQLLDHLEKDRQRIAQEIHDETIQTLMVISNHAEVLAASSHTDKEAQDINWIQDATLQTIEDLRRISIRLRPQVLDYFGLIPAIRWLTNNFNTPSDTRVDVKILGEERKLPSAIELSVFRFVQEALTNIKRHSYAKTAVIILEFTNKSLIIHIYDDGCGFQLPERLGSLATKGKLGMIGMEQRIKSVGGTVKFISMPANGTTIRAEIKC
jgi:signal transduction histidine kinase